MDEEFKIAVAAAIARHDEKLAHLCEGFNMLGKAVHALADHTRLLQIALIERGLLSPEELQEIEVQRPN